MRPTTCLTPDIDLVALLVDDIAQRGWSAVPNFLPRPAVTALAAEIQAFRVEDELRPAGIGRADVFQVRRGIRGDLIRWIDPLHPSHAQRAYLDRMEAVRLELNRALFMGLFSFECHLAVYPTGTYYQRHLDTFRDHGAGRLLSCILYLNDDWQPEHGGQLRLYLEAGKDTPFVDVQPEAGTFVCFLSETYEHEVLTAHRPRMSVTGWFAQRLEGG